MIVIGTVVIVADVLLTETRKETEVSSNYILEKKNATLTLFTGCIIYLRNAKGIN